MVFLPKPGAASFGNILESSDGSWSSQRTGGWSYHRLPRMAALCDERDAGFTRLKPPHSYTVPLSVFPQKNIFPHLPSLIFVGRSEKLSFLTPFCHRIDTLE